MTLGQFLPCCPPSQKNSSTLCLFLSIFIVVVVIVVSHRCFMTVAIIISILYLVKLSFLFISFDIFCGTSVCLCVYCYLYGSFLSISFPMDKCLCNRFQMHIHNIAILSYGHSCTLYSVSLLAIFYSQYKILSHSFMYIIINGRKIQSHDDYITLYYSRFSSPLLIDLAIVCRFKKQTNEREEKSKSSHKFNRKVTIRRRQYSLTTFRFRIERKKNIAQLTKFIHAYPPTESVVEMKINRKCYHSGPEIFKRRKKNL